MSVRFAFSLSRIYQYFEGQPFAIISAYLSGDPDNEERAARMKQQVRQLGYGYREIKGVWVEPEGPHAGETLVEFPLFIPGITYDDALQLALGGYHDRKPQYSFIHSDGETVAEIESVSETIRQEFEDFEANDLNRIWQYYSEFRGRKLRYSSVEWDMAMPPSRHPRGAAETRGYYSTREDTAHGYYYRRPTPLWTAAMTRNKHLEARTGATVVYSVVRPSGRERVVTSCERRPSPLAQTATRTAKVAKWTPARFRRTYRIPDSNERQWELHPRNLLLSRSAYDDKTLERISWHPLTGEMILSGRGESYHAHDIHNHGSYPFDEYVRAIVLPDKRRVVVRPWWPYRTDETMRLDPGEAEIVSFEAQDALRGTLAQAGMPKSWRFEYDGDNRRLEQLTQRRDW